MNVLLTGATGRLGSVAFAQLVDAGYDVIATDVSRRLGLPGRVRVGDLLDREFCYDLVEGVDTIVHLANHPNAGVANAQRIFNENVSINMNLLQAAMESGVRKFVYASSIQAMSGVRTIENAECASSLAYIPMDSNLPQNPWNSYGLSKCVGEQQLQYAVKNQKLSSAVAIRFPLLMLPQWMADWRTRQTGPLAIFPGTNVEEAFTWLSTDDAARLLVAAVKTELSAYRCYMPAHPRPRIRLTPQQIIERYFPGVPLRKPIEQIEALVDISGITADTGWVPVDDLA